MNAPSSVLLEHDDTVSGDALLALVESFGLVSSLQPRQVLEDSNGHSSAVSRVVTTVTYELASDAQDACGNMNGMLVGANSYLIARMADAVHGAASRPSRNAAKRQRE